MPPRLEFRTYAIPPAVPAQTGALAGMAGNQRGISGATQLYEVWNDYDGIGASVAYNVRVMAFYQMVSFDPYISSGVEPADQGWLEARLTGEVRNPDGLTDPDYQTETTEWVRVGGRSVFALPRAIPPHYARVIEFRQHATTGGGQVSIFDIRAGLSWDQGMNNLDIFSDERLGRGVVFPGGPSYKALLTAKELQGAQVKRASTFGGANATPLLEEMVFCLDDEIIRTKKQEFAGPCVIVLPAGILPGIGETISVTVGAAAPVVLTGGVSFAYGATPTITATNMAAAITTLVAGASATSTAAHVDVISTTGYDAILLTDGGGVEWVVQDDTTPAHAVLDYDANGAATVAAEAYWNTVYKSPTGTAFFTKKGTKATSGNELPPNSPGTGYIPVATFSKPNDAISLDITDPTNVGVHQLAHLTTAAASGVSSISYMGPYMALLGGMVYTDQTRSAEPGASLTANTTNFVKLLASGLIEADTTPPQAGEILIGLLLTDAGDTHITNTQDRSYIHGRGMPLTRRVEIPLKPYRMDDEDPVTGMAFGLGYFDQLATGAAGLPYTINYPGNHRLSIRVSVCAGEYGYIDVDGDSINGAGTIVSPGVTESFLVNKVADWFHTGTRWASTNPVIISDPGAVFATLELVAHASDLWNDDDRPFQIRKLKLNVIPETVLGAFTFNLVKVPRLGGVLTTFTQTLSYPTLGAVGIEHLEEATISAGGVSSDCKLYSAPWQAVIRPWEDEGIYLAYTSLMDIKKIDGYLLIDRLLD